MKSIKKEFTNSHGDKISALLDLPPDQKPRAYALFAHCFTCSKNLNTVRNLSLGLTQEGIGVLRFDFTGLGNSEGNFADTNFSTNIADLVEAAQWLEKEHAAPKLLVGHSLGGAAVLRASLEIDSVEAIATIGAPAEPPHVKKLLKEGIEEIESSGEATVNISGRSFKIKKQFLDDLEKHQLSHVMEELRTPLLIMHSPQDSIVSVDNASQIYNAAHHPKSFITLDGADHLMNNPPDSIYAGKMVASWASRYLSYEEEKKLDTDQQVVVHTSKDGYTSEILAGKHHLLADEPEDVGGQNLGPTPYDLLVSGLGACTSMTLRMYADRKEWPLTDVVVHLKHEKRHAQDCEDVEKKEPKLDHIDRYIELHGDLSDEQRARLMEIADKCPVHRTLHSQVVVNTEERTAQEK